MPISKYPVRSTCLSFGHRISATVAAVVAKVEDHHQPRAYLVHEGCQSTLLKEIPFDDDSKKEENQEATAQKPSQR